MKKVRRAAALIAAALLALMVTGCSNKCKASGCDKEATTDGYCDIHYAANAIGNVINDLF